ncbi:MAG: hypothetical protein V4718_00685 [Pseudomonadota bacterium]
MEQIINRQVTEVKSVALSKNLEQIGLSLGLATHEGAEPFSLAIPTGQVPRLIALLSSVLSAAAQREAQAAGSSLQRIQMDRQNAGLIRVQAAGLATLLPSRQTVEFQLAMSDANGELHALPVSMTREVASALISSIADVIAS